MKRVFFLLLLITHFATAKGQKTRPDFFEELHLEDTTGVLFNTASLKNKIIYVDFWFTTCPPCISEIPWSQALQQFFLKDTNIVFVSICIENMDRKTAWKKMVAEKEMKGIHLFYARNRPQTVNLLRAYDIKFPTYILVNQQMKVISYDMPLPSQTGWIYWLLTQAAKGITPHEAAMSIEEHYDEYTRFMADLKTSLPPGFVK